MTVTVYHVRIPKNVLSILTKNEIWHEERNAIPLLLKLLKCLQKLQADQPLKF